MKRGELVTQGRAIVDDAEFSAPMAESRDTKPYFTAIFTSNYRESGRMEIMVSVL
jgi:hypothetical protein